MKAYEIALFLFVLQIAIGLLVFARVFPNNNLPINYEILEEYNQTVHESTYNADGDSTQQGGAELQISGSGFTRLAKALFNVKGTMTNFGIDSTIAGLISYIVYLIWIIGLYQFFRGSSINQME